MIDMESLIQMLSAHKWHIMYLCLPNFVTSKISKHTLHGISWYILCLDNV